MKDDDMLDEINVCLASTEKLLEQLQIQSLAYLSRLRDIRKEVLNKYEI